MAIVAVAGGTGGVEKTIVEDLQHHGAHKLFILGRKAPADSTPWSPTFLVANYSNVEALTTLLDDHKIDTVVSALNLETEAGGQSQLNLIAAADKSRTTRRFIPSEFVTPIDEDDPNSGPGMGGWIPNARALKKTSLEYIRISIGFFSDYWGMPHIKSNLKDFRWLLDIEKGIAVIPGSGNDKFTVTYSEDLARFIARLIDTDEKWPQHGFLSGSDISVNELIAIAERIRGSKMDIIYDPIDKLERGDATILWHPEDVTEEEFKPLLAGLCRMIVAGACILPDDDRRLDKRFPDVPLTSVEEIIVKAWAGKSFSA
ncbi:hypothetical protein H9Q72_005146 [Fusarium xylarioides]|uniref:NmrA-like domain-containing protein n=1 Tax=Fusarium xylarioides TaxID=221167 RepID=A0A9P7ISE8_9HYPO|nr:hypothetical protein H9Q72_005146 [Fusarium xylarioides]KAG5815050.1 hypothetical protein H9Q71_002943 [Fusarium xylarioides]KAG5826939.1 hypothetical protein H9Q74_002960 [Fusarium xylarioides]